MRRDSPKAPCVYILASAPNGVLYVGVTSELERRVSIHKQDLREGLPQTSCYFTVLRQAMAGDRRDPAGLYFGTNSGSVFASRDEGDTWHEIARHLPTILSVEVLDRA